MEDRYILVVSGDFDMIKQVRQALQGRQFVIRGAYSHRDAAHTLKVGEYAAAMVDAKMYDRNSGEYTLLALEHLNSGTPLIAIQSDDKSETGNLPNGIETTALEKQSIQQIVTKAVEGQAQQLTIADEPLNTPMRFDLAQRVEEIQTLFSLGKSLTEVLNLSTVLNRVVEAAKRMTNADEGMILLPDGETGELYLRARVGFDVEVAHNFRIKTRDTVAGTVFSTGQPILIGARGPQKVKTQYFVNSLLYVPILLKGAHIGVLGVNNRTKHDVFTGRHQELLLNLASYAAIAIENARVHEESIKRARELKALVDASQVINSSLSLRHTLPNICEQLATALNTQRTVIFEWDSDHDGLRLVASHHRATWRAGQEPTISMKQRPRLQTALENRMPYMVREAAPDTAEEYNYAYGQGAEALLVIPVYVGEQIVGVLQAFYIQSPGRTPDTDAIMRAQQIAIQGIANISNRTSKSGSTTQLFKFGRELNSILGSDWFEVALYKPGEHLLNMYSTVGSGVWLTPPRTIIKLSDYPDLGELMKTQDSMSYQSDDDGSSPGARHLLQLWRARSILVVPLVNRGETRGLVTFADTENASPFSSREIDMARAIVGQAATALENAQLVHDLEASLKELKETQERLIQTARLSAMGELAAAVAHQINNPLTTIVLDTELMLLSEDPSSPRYETLQAIMRAGKRAGEVVRRLLATARPSDPGAHMEPVNVVSLIEGVLSMVKSHIERDHVRLLVRFPKGAVPPIMAVPGELDDVWLNLLLNAHDALRGCPNPEIGIDLFYEPAAPTLDVVIRDNGPGIPEDVVHRIFDPFFTTKPVGEGTGLGLHICRQVVDRVGGVITVNSSPGEGTEFIVRLPVEKGA